VYDWCVPKLWSQTVDAHRHEVREAIVDTGWELAAEHGPLSMTMSQVAQETGIGRATLYKYFPNVATILLAGHDRLVRGHLAQLAELCDGEGDPCDKVENVLFAYAHMCYHRAQYSTVEMSGLLHRPENVAGPELQLRALFEDLLTEAAGTATAIVRNDVAPGELATYCLHALTAASEMSSKSAVERLVTVTLDALRH